MGKKAVCQASLKISKNINEKQQFNSLIKVLRPKVYITDPSSFKNLVQELTGNGSSRVSSPPMEPKEPKTPPPVLAAEDQRESENNLEAGSANNEEPTNSSSDLWYSDPLINEGFDQVYNQLCLDDSNLDDLAAKQPIDHLLEYQNLESLLLDVEADPFYNCYAQIEQEVSIYDYEWSGMI